MSVPLCSSAHGGFAPAPPLSDDLPRRAHLNLLPDDATALAALRGIRAHLAEGGTALVPLFTPGPTPAEQIG